MLKKLPIPFHYTSYKACTTLFYRQHSQHRARLLHCYRRVITGFAAILSAEEVEFMANEDWFISASLDKLLPLHTTHSMNFLGLHQNIGLLKDSNNGTGIVIGILDSGIVYNHSSFSDDGIPPPPAKWKGRCDLGPSVCNNKIIRAISFLKGNESTPKDTGGHGSHVAGIATGNFVSEVNMFNQAKGTAIGAAPGAHLAIYKVCSKGCPSAAILAGIDAINDGVDVLSLSLGSLTSPFNKDNTAIGTFAAIKHSIFVSWSGGNRGPSSSTVGNEAPWYLTVGASTTDRVIHATVVLGNKAQINGESLLQLGDVASSTLVYPGQTGNRDAAQRYPEELAQRNFRGMVVVCDYGGISGQEKGLNLHNAGAVIMILVNLQDYGYTISTDDPHVLPAAKVSYEDGNTIKAYIKSTTAPSLPEAAIQFKGTILDGERYAPQITYFSSRGPNRASPNILKPDIIGPGNNILSAAPYAGARFRINSGTSMATPYLSGVAALIKKMHPTWSPAKIKSAMMTTAYISNKNGYPITDHNRRYANWYDMGAGHVDPLKAVDPGLVYDIQPKDYIPYLCGLKYTVKEVSAIVKEKVSCNSLTPIREAQLNYPTIAVTLARGNDSQVYERTVTNVGDAISTYNVQINIPKSAAVTLVVMPKTISFTKMGQQFTYKVAFTRLEIPKKKPPAVSYHGYLTWTSDKHVVRSQISIVL